MNYGVIITVILYAKANVIGIFLSAVSLLLLIAESMLYFHINNNLSD